MSDIVLLYSTAPDMASAEKISSALVESGAAACVNTISGMKSFYKWKGATEQANEIVLIIKTSRAAAPLARGVIQSLHPYETPALLALPVDADLSSAEFLSWIRDQASSAG